MYCKVKVHHRNGKAEKCRLIVMKVMHKWPEAITLHLCPCVVRLANEARNQPPSSKNGMNHIATFSKTNRNPKISRLRAFGWQSYMLVSELQAKKNSNNWKPQCKIGIYLGPSLSHASNVHFIMSPSTRHLSPQFHVMMTTSIKLGVAHKKWNKSCKQK